MSSPSDAPSSQPRYRQLRAGDPAPWFQQRNTSAEAYKFDIAAGRYIVLCFFGSARHPAAQQRLAWIAEHRAMFDDHRLSFFGVSVDATDESSGLVQASLPGIRHFWDQDRHVCRLYGALPSAETAPAHEQFRPLWLVLNPNLQVRQVIPFPDQGGADLQQLAQCLDTLPPLERFGGMEMHAPVIMLPDIFEPAFCRRLIEEYEHHGGVHSGFVRDEGGKTVGLLDARHKVRRDHLIDQPALRSHIQGCIRRRVVPMIQRVHSFEATRLERYLLACYDADDGGHFRPHRDNTTFGTAHRRFALSINLSDDFDGGDLVFPEFGPRRYKPPVGAGVVFSCSLLHAVEPVLRGRRYAFLPFLYDDAAAALRVANHERVDVENLKGAVGAPATGPG